jgi:hypothetical protein
MTEAPRNVYRNGAEDGLIMGPLLALTVLTVAATSYVAALFLPSILLLIAVPTVAYLLLARRYNAAYDTYSAVWMHGICIFFFGGLLLGAFALVCLKWVWPGYIADQLTLMVNILSTAPDAQMQEMATNISNNIHTGLAPTPIDIAIELIMMSVFSGSLLSMALAWVIRRRRKPTVPPFNQE